MVRKKKEKSILKQREKGEGEKGEGEEKRERRERVRLTIKVVPKGVFIVLHMLAGWVHGQTLFYSKVDPRKVVLFFFSFSFFFFFATLFFADTLAI